jgi:EmrB/QacA subfamily drug resistance transporter
MATRLVGGAVGPPLCVAEEVVCRSTLATIYAFIIIMKAELLPSPLAAAAPLPGPPRADPDPGQQRVVLAICCLILFVVGLDVTIVNVALPSIGRDLGTGVSGLQWTVSAYAVAMASLLMLSGAMADRLGHRRVFIAGLTIFSGASCMCGFAPTVELLVAFRVLQGVGAAMLNPVAMSIIATTFTDPAERARALGIRGAVAGLSMAFGPTVGGLVVSSSGWRPIFWMNLPIGLVAIALTLRFVPASAGHRRRFDPVGQTLMTALLASLTYAIIEAASAGWTAPAILVALTVAGFALAGIIAYEPRRADPLIDLRFFRSAPFSAATVIAVAAFAAFGGFLFLTTLSLQSARGLSAIEAGLAMLPMAAAAVIGSPWSGRLVGRSGPRLPLLGAGICAVVACAALALLDPRGPLLPLLAAYAVFGFGFGLVNAPITNAAVAGMPRAQAGVASAIATTSRQIGLALGVAVVGTVLDSDRDGAAFAAASQPAWWVLTGCAAVVLVLGLLATTRRAEASAVRNATLLGAAEAAQ